MISVGKKRRPAKRLVSADFDNGLRRAAGSADLVDWPPIHRNEEDDALIIPCRAKSPPRPRLTYDLDSARAGIDRFEFALSEKPDLVAIRGPERVHCALGAR